MPRFRDTREFGPTLDVAAEQLGISATAVEKDYWVSQVLQGLAADHRDTFVFKGGTSLSKAHGIVQRFSEDIDVLVLPGDRGRGSTDKLMKSLGAVAATSIAGHSEPTGGAETGLHRAFTIHYPATRPATELLATSVVLEMGVRGGPNPHELMPIGSLLGDALAAAGQDLTEFSDLAAFDVHVLHPGRTLLEKLVLVHGLAQQLAADASRKPDGRAGRHFYDIHELLAHSRVVDFLADRTQFDHVIASIAEINEKHFKHDTLELRPASGFAVSAAFDRDTDACTRLRDTYESTMPELYFGSSPLPSWDSVCDRVHETRDLL